MIHTYARTSAFTLPGAAKPSDSEENFTTKSKKSNKFLYENPFPAAWAGSPSSVYPA
jgi:hypothetical protein